MIIDDEFRPAWNDLPPALRKAASPTVMLGQAVIEWLKIGLAWVAMAATLSHGDLALPPGGRGMLLALLIVLVAGRLQALGVVLHDACHMARAPGAAHARSDRRLGLLAVLAGHPIATTIEAMRFHHLRHHRFSCLAADPYLKAGLDGPQPSRFRAMALRLGGGLIAPFWSVRALLGTVITILGAAGTDRGRAIAWRDRLLDVYRRGFLQDRGATSRAADRESLACARADPAQLAFLAASLLATWHWPQALLLGYWLPLVLAGMLNAHRVLAEHVHRTRADDSLASMLATTVSHRGFWSRIVFYPRHIGLHEAHHLYPTVPLAVLPALDRWLQARRTEIVRD